MENIPNPLYFNIATMSASSTMRKIIFICCALVRQNNNNTKKSRDHQTDQDLSCVAAERVGLHNMNHGTVSNSGGIRIENSSLHTLLHFLIDSAPDIIGWSQANREDLQVCTHAGRVTTIMCRNAND